MRIGHLELEHLRGLSDKVVGLTKETVGTAVNNGRLINAGEAQQERGRESLKALRKRAEAQAKDVKARGYEAKQRAAQTAKGTAA